MDEPLEKTIERCTQELSLDEASRSFVDLAEAYRKLGKYDEAIQTLLHGLLKRPTFVPAKIKLAQCHFENGSASESRVLLEQVLRVSPDHLLAMKLLATIFYEQKNVESATPLLDKILKLDPMDIVAAEQKKQLQGSFSQSIPISPTLAQMYKKQGHVQEAIDVYRALLKQEPTHVEYVSEVEELERSQSFAKPVEEGREQEFLHALLQQIHQRRRVHEL